MVVLAPALSAAACDALFSVSMSEMGNGARNARWSGVDFSRALDRYESIAAISTTDDGCHELERRFATTDE